MVSASDTALVTVIIPAFNAQRTINATLASVRQQTYRHLEIFVVDDGSSDSTRQIVDLHAAQDSRIIVLSQSNQGVAAARNLPLAQMRGEFVAPIDSDDLWAPDKIARQVEVIEAAGPSCGLVYCWFAIIDAQNRVVLLKGGRDASGNVLEQMSISNLVGHGSGALLRSRLMRDIGGFDVALRGANSQGSEDWKLYLQCAERADFAVVQDYLVGYREESGNMSHAFITQLRSHDLVAEELASRRPELRPALAKGKSLLLRFMMARCLREKHYRNLARLAVRSFQHDFIATIIHLGYFATRLLVPNPPDAAAKGSDFFAFCQSRAKTN